MAWSSSLLRRPTAPACPTDALGDELELVLIVWEAAQGTPLPAYVARYTSQIPGRSDDPSSPRKAERGSAAASAVAGGGVEQSRPARTAE